MASKEQVAAETARTIETAARAIEGFCEGIEPGTDAGIESQSLEEVAVAVEQLLHAIGEFQMALYVAAQHAARR
jgi:hypothetical protein